jgi:hypothetical protein
MYGAEGRVMAEIVEFPVAAGGVLRVQAADSLPENGGQELVPATGVGEKVQRARETLETAIGSVTPALGVITRQLRELSPDEVTVEFGIVLGVEHGAVIAKGKGEVHFTVTLAWKGSADAAAEAGPGGG